MSVPTPDQDDKPRWLQTLLRLMEAQDMNPRMLSLRAGLNPTAVRDMLSGRARYPRYDTLKALAKALHTTPAFLMGDAEHTPEATSGQLDLLTEIISRLQEVADEMRLELSPRALAVMATTIYRQIQESPSTQETANQLQSQVRTLITYASHDAQVRVRKRVCVKN